MKWFEPIIAIVAVFLVILPFILNIRKKKKGKKGCGCGCSECSKKNECYVALKAYLNSSEYQKDMEEINKESKIIIQ